MALGTFVGKQKLFGRRHVDGLGLRRHGAAGQNQSQHGADKV
jgi:hypothetical protein